MCAHSGATCYSVWSATRNVARCAFAATANPPVRQRKRVANDVRQCCEVYGQCSLRKTRCERDSSSSRETNNLHKATTMTATQRELHTTRCAARLSASAFVCWDYKRLRRKWAIDLSRGETERERGETHHTWTWPNAQIAEAEAEAEAEAATATAAARERKHKQQSALSHCAACSLSQSLSRSHYLCSCKQTRFQLKQVFALRSHHVAGIAVCFGFAVLTRALFTVVTSPFWHFQLAASDVTTATAKTTRWRCVALPCVAACGEFRKNVRLRQRTWRNRNSALILNFVLKSPCKLLFFFC